MMVFFGPDPQRGGLTVLTGNAKIIEIVPVLNETFRHTLCHVETLQTYSNSKQEEGALPIHIFNMLTQNLPVFLSKVYTEVEEARKWHTTRGNKLSASVLVNVNTHFFKLDASIQSTCGYSLGFHKITHDDQNEQWTNEYVQAAIDFTYTNLDILDAYFSALVSRYRKPRKIAQHWMYYTLGAIGISIFSVWLLRRSGLSHSIDDSVLEAIGCLFKAHVEQHVSSAKRKGKAKRRVLLSELECRINEFVKFSETAEELRDKSSEYLHGMVLCTLNKYYKKIERYAEATGEWDSLKWDLIELGKSSHDSAVRLNRKRIIDRLYNSYICTKKMPDQ